MASRYRTLQPRSAVDRRTVTRQKREAMAKLGVTNDPGLFSYVRAYGILNFKSHI